MARLSLFLRKAVNASNPPTEARLLQTLQELLKLPALELRDALMAAAQRIAEALACDKVDAFLLDEATQTLEAIGTSDTPMGQTQHALGLNLLPLANGGRIVECFNTGKSRIDGKVDEDPEELRGIVEGLGVRSTLAVAFDVGGARRGVLSAVSAQRDFFQPSDLIFLEAVARWVGIITDHAQRAEQARRTEAERARRAGADEIITVLAHDLRNHLHPLLSRLQLLRLNAAAGRAVEAKELETAVRSVQRLARLTTDLLDAKRLDEGLFSLNLVAVDLTHIAKETAGGLATASVPVQVEGADTLVVIADADRVRQALENLIANAVKYSPPGSAVRVAVTAEHDGKAIAVLEVSDQGPGIAPELLPRLFDRFIAGPGSSGLGLGLYLAHRIARVHGGNLSVHSTPGTGTRFRLEFPLTVPDHSSVRPPSGASHKRTA
jgi:two-component system OmpR family sensor kinase